MKKVLILIFILMTVFIMPSFASPTGGGDFLLELSIPSFVDADLSIVEDQAEFLNMESNFIVIENTVPVARSKMHISDYTILSMAKTGLTAVETNLLKITTMSVFGNNFIRADGALAAA